MRRFVNSESGSARSQTVFVTAAVTIALMVAIGQAYMVQTGGQPVNIEFTSGKLGK